MPGRRSIFLTGASGFLGQYLLSDLLARGFPVAVLIRDSRRQSARERVEQILDYFQQRIGHTLPRPTVLTGDLVQPNLGLTAVDRQWLGSHCDAVLHSAACVTFRETADGEPWRTNRDGLRNLLSVCLEIGLKNWHHISTAFVSGSRTGDISEQDLDAGQTFRNCYEESKFQGEKLLRGTPALRATFYRPSVIVGDSQTGHTTSYTGFYRFLEMATRLAALHARESDADLPLRLPLSGHEQWNLVTVDWVSRAIVELFLRPECHAATYHLVSPAPVSTSLLREVGAAELGMNRVTFAGSTQLSHPSQLEELFLGGIEEYRPYLEGNPKFSTSNVEAFLPHLPPTPITRALLVRLIRFAVAHRWGRGPAAPTPPRKVSSPVP